MRIITGRARGARLKTPKGLLTRPTSDRVKESLFSILGGRVVGRRVLDLFAGTGALGIEALSRGASECVFVDHSRQSIGLIKRNLAHCGAGEQARVLAGDYRKILAGLSGSFDIILMDPPYDKGLLDEAMRLVREHDLLAEDGVIICEHRKEEDLPEEIHGFVKQKERRYGIVKLSIYR